MVSVLLAAAAGPLQLLRHLALLLHTAQTQGWMHLLLAPLRWSQNPGSWRPWLLLLVQLLGLACCVGGCAGVWGRWLPGLC
jgi:hypothetical protein